MAGEAAEALAGLGEAAAHAEAGHMPLVAAAARLRLGDPSGASRMRELGVVRPERMAEVLAPGWPATPAA